MNVYEKANKSEEKNHDLMSFHKTSQRYVESSNEINLIDVEGHINSSKNAIDLNAAGDTIVFTTDDD